MTKPWEISSDDIREWASRYEAAAILPKLVRRLLFATSPLGAIDLRGDAGVRLEGWDGMVRARSATAFCPGGLSVWELSVEAKSRAKVGSDFEKRSSKPPAGVQPAVTAYIAVTARAFPRKAAWAREQRALGIWSDVRVYDADDLATWIEQAPAVARWFANLLGRPAYEGNDIEAYLEAWARRTTPPLPPSLVLAGAKRSAQSDEFLAWLGSSDGLLVVQGRTRDEAALFAAATLARGPHAEARLSRALIIETPDAWRWVLGVQRGEELIAVPVFDTPDSGQAAAARVRVVLPTDRNAPVRIGSTLILDQQPYPPLADELMSAGWGRTEAQRMVSAAGGDVHLLQRLAGYVDVELPPWARQSPRAEMVALMLAGAWVPTADGDREVLRTLGGDPALAEQMCADLQARNVVTREGEHFALDVLRWTSPSVVWGMLAPAVTDSHLNRFREAVKDVLGSADPAYELPKEERFMAAAKGKARRHSDALREGLAASILRLSFHNELLAASRGGDSKAEGLAGGLVGWLLRHEGGWVAWASLSKLLPVLAEAAPDAFLDRLERSVDQRDDGVARLFHEETQMGAAPHTGLLWALEVLGWHPEARVRARVVRALTRLDVLYPREAEGKVINRPVRSLNTLLRYALPKSNTTHEERVKLLSLVFEVNAPTGRELTRGMVRDLRGAVLLDNGVDPSLRTWKPVDLSREVDPAAAWEQANAAIALLIADAGHDPKLWADLLETVVHGEAEEDVVAALGERKAGIRDDDGVLWRTIRRMSSHVIPGPRTPPLHERLDALFQHFTPTDLVRRHAWLFTDSHPELRGLWIQDINEWGRRIAEARQAAIEEIWIEGGWGALERLVREIRTAPGGADELGIALASSSMVLDLDLRVLGDDPSEVYASLTVGFGSARAQSLGPEWLQSLLTRLAKTNRDTAAALIAARGVDFRRLQYRELWDMLAAIGASLETKYWEVVSGLYGNLTPDDLRYAVEHLSGVGRAEVAVRIAAMQTGEVGGELAMLVLEKFRQRTATPPEDTNAPAARREPVDYYLERLFERIDRDLPPGREQDVALLELYFLPALKDGSRPTRYVSGAFAGTPDLFVRLVGQLYRREGDDPPSAPDPDRARLAEAAYTILHAWKGYPGEGMLETERDAALERWAREVLQKTRDDRRGRVGCIHVAEVLARVPPATDGVWPCFAARRLLESGTFPDFAEDIARAQWNRRGGTVRALDEGGIQERELVDTYREGSLALEGSYPRTAAMLDGLARTYEQQADREDAQARQTRIESSEQADEPPPRPTTSPVPAPTNAPISRLVVTGVGPAREFDVPLRAHLNLLIGDNSLGKTFILDVLWWALTGSWPISPARPPTRGTRRRPTPPATIRAEADGHALLAAEYDSSKERWKRVGTRVLARGLTLYAGADGRFWVWDPLRNAKTSEKGEDLSKGYHFAPSELWDGLLAKDRLTQLCRGLNEDVVSWRSERKEAFAALQGVLDELSPPDAPIKLGLPQRLTVRDARTYPTLDLGYDARVFAIHASTAVKRILGLAYLLVWAVSEIRQAAPIAGHAPLGRVTLLIDEVDAHLHPRWQRVVLPALLAAVERIAPQAEVQILATTHSPLVLASVEMVFDPSRDILLEFTQETAEDGRIVRVVEDLYERTGDANAWLTQRFGLKQPRSVEAEAAIERASQAVDNKKTRKKEGRAIHNELVTVLGQLDPFWARWRHIAERRGWLP